MTTRAEKLVALAKMRQDWRNVNDCINDDLTKHKVEWVIHPWQSNLYGSSGSVCTAANVEHIIKHRPLWMSAYAYYEHKKYLFKRKRYEQVIQWGKQTLSELLWLKEEIIKLEKELYYK
ncbi:hypothetical protein E4849_23525 [Salmonella enterica subsp. enterica serovar Anatum]|nr:hypothetical protein E4850_23550 [Salmonella enterica subsp. enterica serovar Anatum]KAA7538304.1 hypothetical protein E4849_23525 [Salmonella enterica subsp. enterica serovar Anatum]KAA7929246.1 hypothetical protein E4761_24140 [Salmonella enterica subsp. enterica serovar Anatum]KAA7962216.1 hypothetical protein E4757_23350 [Salmonella enterica subsp. enterica serovar Anatum]